MFKGRDQNKGGQRNNFIRKNEGIRISPVMVIHDKQNLGTMPTSAALARAKEYGLDLVEVAPDQRPPVCQIMDFGKFMFDKKRKEKEKQKQHGPKEKEVRFRYVIGEHDLQAKANHIREFLEKGMKVKCVVTFKQREKAHKEQGFVLLDKLLKLLADVATVEKPPNFEGANVMVRLDLRKDYKKHESKATGTPTEGDP